MAFVGKVDEFDSANEDWERTYKECNCIVMPMKWSKRRKFPFSV